MASTLLAFQIADIGTTRALVAIAAIIFIMFILNRNARRRRLGLKADRPEPALDAETARATRLRREMEQLLVELNEFARTVNGQIETRFAKLEQSIADADRRIAELRRLRGESGGGDAIDESVLRANRDAAAGVRERIGGAQTDPRSRLSKAAGAPAPAMSNEDAVYEMADNGKSSIEIARALKCTIGEVELILNLRDRG